MTDKLTLTDDLFIGAGGHQATYIHPIDRSKCIKIPHDPNDGDVKKEMRYRRICSSKLENSELVTKYYGFVDTDKGLGHVFERVLDLNGETSKDLKDFLPQNIPPANEQLIIRSMFKEFKTDFLRENIAIVDMDITNFMAQQVEPDKYKIRIVDNIGTPVLIPLVYYFDFVAAWKCRRYWNFLVEWLHARYPYIITEAFFGELKV